MAPIRTPSRPSSPSPPASLTDSPSHSSSLTLELPRSTTDNELALSDGASSEGEGSTASSSKRAKGKGMQRRRSSAHRVRETLNAKSISLDDGKRTVNQYRLGPEIGKGAFGRVELGVDVQTGITYAIKEYSKSRLRRQVHQRSMANARSNRGRPRRGGKDATIDVTSTSEGKDRNRVEEGNPLALIAREMAIMKKLDHPNLIHLYEVLDVPDEDSLFMVLEYCSGGILMELPPLHPPSNPSSSASEASTSSSAFPTPVRPPMSLLSAKRYFSQILMGLEYLHENDVVHLDLKPENILLGADGKTAKLCDFGVSEMFKQRGDDRVRKGMGSPAFQSPESLGEGREIHAKAADVWALGITLYCMRSGFLPFRYDNPLDLFEAIKHERILFPPHFTGAGRDIIERLLERDPEKRITIDEIRVHPWLSDIDMPSKEENLAEERMVDEPSQSEINDAIRSISSAFAVIRAVQKFKKLGAQGSANRASRSEISSRQSTLDSSAVSMTSESPPITRPSTPSSSFSARHPSPTVTSSLHLAGREDAARKSSEGDLDGQGKPREEGQIGEDITSEPEEYSEEPMEISNEPVDLSDEPLEITDEPFEISDEPESIEEPPTLASQPPSFYPARSVSQRPRPPSPSSSISPDQIVRPRLHATLPPPTSFSRSDHPARTSSSSSSSSSISSPSGSARPDRPRLNLEVTDYGSTRGGKGERTPEAEGGDANALGAGLSSKFGMIVVESPGGGRSELG